MSKIDLYHGDCLKILPTLQQKFSAVIADPPYGKLNKKCKWDNIIPIDKMWECILPLCNDTTPIILFSQEPYTSELIISNKKMFKYKLYWQKTQPTGHFNANKQPLKDIEEILVFYNKQCTYNPQKTQNHKPVNSYTKYERIANNTLCYGNSKTVSGGGNTDRYPKQVLTFKSDKQKVCLHPTQKPLTLMEWLIKTYTNEGDAILDFCMGSGTTGEACKNLNRNFTGIEIVNEYFEISKERIIKEVQGE